MTLCASVVVAGHAHAQSGAEGDSAEAQEQPAKANKKDLTAEELAQYEKHLQAGTAAYKNENFEEAFQSLKAAHDVFPKPSILFNLGLISEKQGKLERAAEYYRKFTEAPGVSLQNRKRASERLAAVQDILKAADSGEAAENEQMTDLLPALEAMEIDTAMEATDGADAKQTDTVASTDQTSNDQTSNDQTSTDQTSTGQTSSDQTTNGGDVVAGGGADAGVAAEHQPEFDYTGAIWGSYAVAGAAAAGGVATLMMTMDRIDQAKAGVASSQEVHQLEEEASMFATATAGLFIGSAVLTGIGTYFVIQRASSQDEEPEAAPASVSLSVGDGFVGGAVSLGF